MKRLFLVLAIIVLGATPALRAQSLSGISGTVADESGLALEAAEVTATNDETGVSTTTTTSSAGVYTITNLPPGTYTVRFSKQGFQPSLHKGVRTEVSRRLTVDAVLPAGTLTESIEVSAPVVALETNQPEVGWTLEKKTLESLPINFGGDVGDRGRQIEALLPLVPGVTGEAFSHRINGGADMQNEIVFEGVPVAQAETQGFQSNINPPYDMVEEFRVVGSTFSAQYGLGHGAVSYKFASGTNEFHGNVFELMRNEALNAAGHTPLEEGKADRDRRHNFGGSLSGPVTIPGLYDGKDRTFFHATVEWFRLNQPVNGRLSLPTPEMKRGDFSAFPQRIFVPDQKYLVPGCTGVTPGQPFPGNRIPESCISNTSRAVLPLIPDPTDSGFENNSPSLITNQPTRQTNWGLSVDHRFSARQNFRLSYWRNTYNVAFETNGAFFTNELTGFKDEPRLGNGIFGTYSNVFSNSLIMTVGFGYMRERNDQFNKFPGYNFPGVVGATSFPTIDFQGNFAQSDFGADAGGLTYSLNNKLGLSFANNWIYTTGRHTLSVGFEARRASQESQECQRCGGRFNFSSNSTADPAALESTGSAFASFMLGIVNTADRGFTPRKFLTNFYVAPYIQDEFKITPDLTLSAGLRWDIMRPFTEEEDKVVFADLTLPNPGAIDPRTNQPLLGAITRLGTGQGTTGYRRAPIDWTHFSPRLGLVYRLNTKTVLSTGVSVSHLAGGTFEFGTNKVANDYSGLLAGQYVSFPSNQTIPGYGQWDGNPLPNPAAPPFGPAIANGQGVRTFSNSGRAPYSISWTAGIQRELPGDLLLTANYVGNRMLHMPSWANPENQLDPKFLSLCTSLDPNQCVLLRPWTSPEAQAALRDQGFGQCDGRYTPYCNYARDKGVNTALADALRPYPQFGGIRNNFETNGTSFYNSAQLSVQRRFRNGLHFLLAYTLAKSMQNGDDSGFSTFNGQPLNKFNPKAEWGVGDNDRRHNLVITAVYELPIKPSGKVAKSVLGGWQVSGNVSYRSGIPFGLGASGSPLLSGNRPNWDPNVPLNVDWSRATDAYRGPKDEEGRIFFDAPLPGETTPYDVFNVAAFSSPGRARLGNAPRRINGLNAQWDFSENLALAKRVYAGRRINAQLRLEFFNVFNRQGFCGVGTNVDDRDRFGLSNARRLRDSAGRVIGVQVSECQGVTPRRGQVFLQLRF